MPQTVVDKGLIKLAVLATLCLGIKFYEGMTTGHANTPTTHKRTEPAEIQRIDATASNGDTLTIMEYHDDALTITGEDTPPDMGAEPLAEAGNIRPMTVHL